MARETVVIDLSDDDDFEQMASIAKRKTSEVSQQKSAKAKASVGAEKVATSHKHRHPKVQATGAILAPAAVREAKTRPPPAGPAPELEQTPLLTRPSLMPISDSLLSTPPVAAQDEDMLDVRWGNGIRSAERQLQRQQDSIREASQSASILVTRQLEKIDKTPAAKKLAFEFEVDNMHDPLASLLKALEKPPAPTPSEASSMRPPVAPLTFPGPLGQRSLGSQQKSQQLAIKSPASQSTPPKIMPELKGPSAMPTSVTPAPAVAALAPATTSILMPPSNIPPPPVPPPSPSPIATPVQTAPMQPAAPRVVPKIGPNRPTPAPTVPLAGRHSTAHTVPTALIAPPPPVVGSKPLPAAAAVVKTPLPPFQPSGKKSVSPTLASLAPIMPKQNPLPSLASRAASLPSPLQRQIGLSRTSTSLPALPPAPKLGAPMRTISPVAAPVPVAPVLEQQESMLMPDDELDQLLSDPMLSSQLLDMAVAAAPVRRSDAGDSAPQQPIPILSAPLSTVRFPAGAPPNVHRMRVQSVSECNFSSLRGPDGANRHRVYSKRVAARDERTGATRFVVLRDEWATLRLAQDDMINIVGDFDADNTCTVDREQNFLIHYPDSLVNITFITSTSPCLRRALLSERYRGYTQNKDAVYGTLIHGVFQSVLHRGDFSNQAIQQTITREIEASLGTLYAVGETEEAARVRLDSYIPSIQSWQKTYVHDSKNANPGNLVFERQQVTPITIPKVLEIEECICSPVYGKIDVSVEMKSDGVRFVAPLELKGGKRHGQEASIYHKAQVYLYMLLMAERYRQPVERGLLFYLSAQMEGLKKEPHVLRSLLVNRNEVARHVANNTLPPPIQDAYACAKCPSQSLCMVVHKATEGGTAASGGVGEETWKRLTEHVSDEHAMFLKEWDHIVDLEAAEYVREQPWLHTSIEQEKRGRCLSDMVLEKQEVINGAYLYHFRKRLMPVDAASPTSQSSRTSLLDLFEVTRGDYVSLSTEDGHYGVARGAVADLAPQHIVIALDDELRVLPRVAEESASVSAGAGEGGMPAPLEGLLDVEREFECLTPGSPLGPSHHYRSRTCLRDLVAKQQVWRIDREDLVSTEGTVRANVATLLTPPESMLRSLVVDLMQPTFDFPAADARLAALPAETLRGLNADQRRSLQMVLAAKHYALILGMPGTGKSTTIVSIVQALVALGHTVLITSYTNNAVDNLLLKLAVAKVDFLRISSRKRDTAKELDKYTLNSIRHKSIEEYRMFVEERKVVGATCLNASSPLIARRRFDYCIVDEASQITLPICLGPLRSAQTFVLVGDHYQLPPVVRSNEARHLGGDVSLFKRLAEQHPQALAALKLQYRMNDEIMILPNALVYEGRLECGTPSIAKRRLTLKSFPALTELIPQNHWLAFAVDPTQAVVFLNTDSLGRMEQVVQGATTGGVYNKLEVKLVSRMVQALCVAGMEPANIGVIAPYRAQLRFIKYAISDPIRMLVEVDTVDRYQGRDKDCIVISLVRSNAQNEVGELLRDARRLNVALSRAKCKLVLIGSRGTFEQMPLYAKLFKILDERQSARDLLSGAH